MFRSAREVVENEIGRDITREKVAMRKNCAYNE